MKPQQDSNENQPVEAGALTRRGFLRGASALGLGAGALALGGTNLLAGCGGGGSGSVTPPPSNTPYTMFISTFLARSVLRFDSRTGRTTELFKLNERADSDPDTSVNAKFPQTTAGLVVSPDKKNLFVFSPGSSQIFMVDTQTGEIKKRISSIHSGTVDGKTIPNIVAPTNAPHDGVIGPDGRLYYVNAPSIAARSGADSVEILDPATGNHLGTYLSTATAPEARAPFGINFGPDGDLYLASVLSFGFNPATIPFRPDRLARFDKTTRRFKNFAVQQQHLTFTMAFHPTTGELLAPSFFFNRIYQYNPSEGVLREAFANVDYPLQVLYGPDGDLFVSSFADQGRVALLTDVIAANDINGQGAGRVLRLDGKTGALKSEVAKNLPYGGFLAFL